MTRAKCPNCQAAYSIKPEFIGKQTVCQNCGQIFTIFEDIPQSPPASSTHAPQPRPSQPDSTSSPTSAPSPAPNAPSASEAPTGSASSQPFVAKPVKRALNPPKLSPPDPVPDPAPPVSSPPVSAPAAAVSQAAQPKKSSKTGLVILSLLALVLAGAVYFFYTELEKSQAEVAKAQAQLKLLADPKLLAIKEERAKVDLLLAEETKDASQYAPGVPMSLLKTAIISELRLSDALLRQEAAALESGAPLNVKANKSTPDPQLAQNLEKELEKLTEYINQRKGESANLTGEAALSLANELGMLHLVKAVVIRNYLTARYGLNSFIGQQPARAIPTHTAPNQVAAPNATAPPASEPPKKLLTVADILGSNSEWKVQGPWATRLAGTGDGLSVRLLRLAAVNHAEINGVPQQASLFIGCQNDKTEMYVTFALPLAVNSNQVEVQYQLDDDGELVKENWNASTDQKGVFTPKPIPLLRKMVKANRILLRVGYHNRESVIETVFFLDGLTEALKPIQSACAWK